MATIKKPAKKMQEGGNLKIKVKIKPDRKLLRQARKEANEQSRMSQDTKKQIMKNSLSEAGYEASQMKMGGSVKKMQRGGVMDTKLKDIPGKVKSTVKKVTDKVKNSSVGDVVDVATAGGYSAAKNIKKGVKAFRDQIGSVNDRMPKKKMGGAVKAKNGKSFPDLNKDGKITKADILKGRGVIAKKGATLKKQAAVAIAMKKAGKAPKKMQYGGAAASMAPTMKKGGAMKKCKYGCK